MLKTNEEPERGVVADSAEEVTIASTNGRNVERPQVERDYLAGFSHFGDVRRGPLFVSFATQTIGTRIVGHVEDLAPRIGDVAADIG